MKLISPYASGESFWLRGNLHTHTTASDGNLSPQAIVAAYASMGYDFLMITDHDQITPIDTLDACGMTLISGNEITANGPHMLHGNAKNIVEPLPDRQEVIRRIIADGGFAIMNHPNWWFDFNHCDQKILETLEGYLGIEIYNGVTLRAEGNPLATDRWDRLLSKGRKVWGFGNDDPHEDIDRAVAWNMVQESRRDPESILGAIAAGRFYVSTGVFIEEISVSDNRIHIATRNGQAIHVVANHGQTVARVADKTLAYALPDPLPRGWTYLRVECYGPGNTTAWTQPFFLE